MIVIDANVASELMRSPPSPVVREWAEAQPLAELRATAITVACYALVVAHRDRIGLPIDGFDAHIAAICRSHGATLATRNVKDFQETGITVVDPWQAG